jgi:CHAT domain-containing protein
LQIEPKYTGQKLFKPQKLPLILENKKAGPSSSQELGWSEEPKVEMLVLSACKTAVVSDEAELVFSGLAVQAGVKTVLGSLWYVSHQASLALMRKFYDQLNTTYLRSDSLEQAQLAMLKGKGIAVHLLYLSPEENIPLNQEMTNLGKIELSHPYY